MRTLAWMALVVLVLAGCSSGPIPGSTGIAEGVYWKLRTLGEGERVRSDSDSLLLRVRVAYLGAAPGSLFSTERWYGPHGAAADLLFARMHVGDSASVAMAAGRVPWTELGAEAPVVDTGWTVMELGLLRLRSQEELRAEQRARLAARTEEDQTRILHDFFAKEPRPWPAFMDVHYMLDSTRLSGRPIQSGDLVTLHYKAAFLDDGHVFDDTHRGPQPLTFRLGDPGQVIKGLEIAAHLLRSGGHGRFVIPAQLAFGPTGSSSGIVPPWTPVLYEVDVVEAAPAAVP